MMMAMKVAVAFQTMAHTVGMSYRETVPAARAMIAPRAAIQQQAAAAQLRQVAADLRLAVVQGTHQFADAEFAQAGDE